MVPVNNWKESYEELIDMVYSNLKPERITFGTLRGLQSTINNCEDKSWIKYLNERSNWGLKASDEIRRLRSGRSRHTKNDDRSTRT